MTTKPQSLTPCERMVQAYLSHQLSDKVFQICASALADEPLFLSLKTVPSLQAAEG